LLILSELSCAYIFNHDELLFKIHQAQMSLAKYLQVATELFVRRVQLHIDQREILGGQLLT